MGFERIDLWALRRGDKMGKTATSSQGEANQTTLGVFIPHSLLSIARSTSDHHRRIIIDPYFAPPDEPMSKAVERSFLFELIQAA
jgi:hypothetical protein